MDKLVLICLGVFLLLFGVFSVTTLGVAWGKELMGFSALVAGVICLIRGINGGSRPIP